MKYATVRRALPVVLNIAISLVFLAPLTPNLWAQSCFGLPTTTQLKSFLPKAATGTEVSAALGPGKGVGGLFGGQRMWAAVVNRDGEVCAVI